jgi:acetylornithine deacetylase
MGVMWLELSVCGRPAHVLDTSAGFNAIEAIYTLFAGLRSLEQAWNEDAAKHAAYRDMKVVIPFVC